LHSHLTRPSIAFSHSDLSRPALFFLHFNLLTKAVMTGRKDRDRDRGDRDRDRDDRKSSKNASSAGASGQRQTQFFINGDGIDREVITTDICRYLGNDALVRPGNHKVCHVLTLIHPSLIVAEQRVQDPRTGQETQGYYITAYRAPTSVSGPALDALAMSTLIITHCRHNWQI
jgi:hypothetical protein